MTTLYYEQAGQGPDLVMLHGWGLHGGVFRQLMDQLSDSFRITAIDLPGHGRSPWQDQDMALDHLADSTAQLVPKPAIWLGWSLGGLVAMKLAVKHPELVKGLVLVAATPKFVQGQDWKAGMETNTYAAFSQGLADDYRATLSRFLSLQTGSGSASRELIRQLKELLFVHGDPDTEALAAGLSLLRDTDLRPELKQITAPTLLIHGGQDRLTPVAASEYLQQSLDHAALTVIEDAGHAPFMSHTDMVETTIRDFADER
jgi:pimeloyl-[acyl-carrier protein] methyl ester esterase